MKKYIEDASVFIVFILVISGAMYFADTEWHSFSTILVGNTIVFGLVCLLDLVIKKYAHKR